MKVDEKLVWKIEVKKHDAVWAEKFEICADCGRDLTTYVGGEKQ